MRIVLTFASTEAASLPLVAVGRSVGGWAPRRVAGVGWAWWPGVALRGRCLGGLGPPRRGVSGFFFRALTWGFGGFGRGECLTGLDGRRMMPSVAPQGGGGAERSSEPGKLRCGGSASGWGSVGDPACQWRVRGADHIPAAELTGRVRRGKGASAEPRHAPPGIEPGLRPGGAGRSAAADRPIGHATPADLDPPPHPGLLTVR